MVLTLPYRTLRFLITLKKDLRKESLMSSPNMSDATTTIEEMKARIRAFRDARGWHSMESPKDATLSLVLEAAELLEHFQWMSDEDVKAERRLRGPIADELADVLW